MPIDKDFNLDAPEGITQADMDEMNAIADELEELANSAEGNVQRIDRASRNALGNKTFAEINVLQNTPEDYDPTANAGGVSKDEMYELIIEILAEQEKAKEERMDNSEAIEEMKTMSQQASESTGQIRGNYGEIISMKRNPKAVGFSKIKGLIGKAGWVGIVANFAIEMGQKVYEEVLGEVKAQFQAGGAWDKRKLVEDELNEYNSIAYLTKVRSGQIYFGADAGQELRQGAPQGSSNTRSLRDGHLRYIQFHGGI